MSATWTLAGKTALVTGAASGIGLATATLLRRAVPRSQSTSSMATSAAPRRWPACATRATTRLKAPGSVAEAGASEAMVAAALDALGNRLDLLVNNAGTPGTRKTIAPARLDLITEELWREVIETNLLGTFPLLEGCRARAAPDTRCDRLGGFDRRHQPARQLARLRGYEGGRGQPHAEPGARARPRDPRQTRSHPVPSTAPGRSSGPTSSAPARSRARRSSAAARRRIWRR